MNQRTFLGMTYLDVAKGAVEAFMKLRARDPASRGDRYMLVTLDDAPYGVKAGWKDDTDTFMCELKNLQAFGLTTLGHALRTAFDLLNINRLVSGIDNYGQGCNPFFLEPSVIITITDGNKLTNSSGMPDELHLPLNSSLAGSELTTEPFRWDQRLFALVLRLPGAAAADNEQLGCVPTDKSAITQICEVTGGRSYCVRSQRMLNQCLESLVQKVQIGVVINFEKTDPESPLFGEDNSVETSCSVSSFNPQLWHSCRKLIYVRPNPKTGWLVGHWPIPESFWPDPNSPSLPPRSAHPVVQFSCVDCEPMVIDKLPFDKYELEPSPLTQYILERKSPHMCWQVFVSNSGKAGDPDKPFGYLKASTTLTCVNLVVMPYNYPVLLPLLDDLFKVHKLKASFLWRQAFEMYLNTMPPYYLLPLKNALRMMGAPYLIADSSTDCGLSYSVISNLKKLSKQAKMESEVLTASVGKKPPQESPTKVKSHLWRDQSVDNNLRDYVSFQMAQPSQDLKPQLYRNAYDIPKWILLDQLTRMRSNLLRASQKLIRSQDEDDLHSVPVAQMGNYQEYLKMMPPPLRDIDINQLERLHTSGNPFKQDKKGHQNHNSGNWSDTNSEALLRRRQSGSPALRRPQTPTPRQEEVEDIVMVVESNGDGQQNLLKLVPQHTGVENSMVVVDGNGDWVPGQQNLFKPISQHKGEENSMVVVESDDDGVPGSESGEIWPSEMDTVAGNPCLLSLEGKVVLGAVDLGEDISRTEERLVVDDRSDKQPLEEKHSCERLNLQNHMDGSEADPAVMETILIDPLDGSQVEVRTRIMREVRKPGRNYKIILELLQEVKGPVTVKMYLIQQAIKEASRFKKRVLIQQLKNILADLEEKYTTSSQLPNGHGSEKEHPNEPYASHDMK